MAEDLSARYDPIADGYARHWGPVIRPAALGVLDRLAERWVEPIGHGGGRMAVPSHLIDIGTGTGTLALAALARWPGVRVTGIDASAEMLARAEREARRTLDAAARSRLELVVAVADRLPFDDATFDGGMSSFVLQLVPNRAAALREALRVLRPGAWFGFVTWMREADGPQGPDRIFDEVLAEFGFDPPEPDPGTGDAASARAAADGLRRAGFREVGATVGTFDHRWTPRSYADFVEHFAEASTFDDLVDRERRAVRQRLIGALRRARPRELRMRLPIVTVIGRRPG